MRPGTGGFVGGVCCRLQDQEDWETLYGQIGAALHSQALVLMGGLPLPGCLLEGEKSNSGGSWNATNSEFILQGTEKPTKRGSVLDLVLQTGRRLQGMWSSGAAMNWWHLRSS